MSPRRSRLALLLVVTLAAMTLSVERDFANERRSPNGKGGDTAFAVRTPRVDVSSVRLTGEGRRDAGASDRSAKPRLIFLAVAAALLALVALGQRRTMLLMQSGPSPVSWWSPRSDRAPPSLQLLRA